MSDNLSLTLPDRRTQAPTETLPYALDTTPVLGIGEAPIEATCELINLATRQPFPGGLLGLPTITGNVITQTVTALDPGEHGTSYRLGYTFTVAVGKTWTVYLRLDCNP